MLPLGEKKYTFSHYTPNNKHFTLANDINDVKYITFYIPIMIYPLPRELCCFSTISKNSSVVRKIIASAGCYVIVAV